jgi:hypothetical protein
MKRFLLAFLAFAFVWSACNNETKTANTTKEEQTKPEVKGISTPPLDPFTEKMEALKKLTPLNLEELNALLPAEMNGMKRSSFNSSSAMGYSVADGSYQKGKSSLHVMVYDCAGEAGSAWYAATYGTKMSMMQETADEYTKTIDFMGGKAIENFKKESKQTSLTFLSKDRILIILSGKNMTPEEVREAATKLSSPAS